MNSVKLKVIPIYVCALKPVLKRHNSLFLHCLPLQQNILCKQTQLETKNIFYRKTMFNRYFLNCVKIRFCNFWGIRFYFVGKNKQLS